jgi:hypothetical protein
MTHFMGGEVPRHRPQASSTQIPMKRNSTKLIYPTTEEKHLRQDLREGEKRGKSIDRERKQTTKGRDTKQKRETIQRHNTGTEEKVPRPQAKGRKRKRENDVFMHNNCSNHATTNNRDAHYGHITCIDDEQRRPKTAKEMRRRQQDERRKEGSRIKKEQSKNHTKPMNPDTQTHHQCHCSQRRTTDTHEKNKPKIRPTKEHHKTHRATTTATPKQSKHHKNHTHRTNKQKEQLTLTPTAVTTTRIRTRPKTGLTSEERERKIEHTSHRQQATTTRVTTISKLAEQNTNQNRGREKDVAHTPILNLAMSMRSKRCKWITHLTTSLMT